ncbi:hypothetical protein CEXT_85801 [Caerostris extrusa]|uniref:Uncharacterized protein n=1 Tax=Caerostris extrusa TaxID=172846 RepID=A0AAV4VFH9_CAEEX|nr:hypothetical protein CEXT_85801 [Caerostris extrusa]
MCQRCSRLVTEPALIRLRDGKPALWSSKGGFSLEENKPPGLIVLGNKEKFTERQSACLSEAKLTRIERLYFFSPKSVLSGIAGGGNIL